MTDEPKGSWILALTALAVGGVALAAELLGQRRGRSAADENEGEGEPAT